MPTTKTAEPETRPPRVEKNDPDWPETDHRWGNDTRWDDEIDTRWGNRTRRDRRWSTS